MDYEVKVIIPADMGLPSAPKQNGYPYWYMHELVAQNTPENSAYAILVWWRIFNPFLPKPPRDYNPVTDVRDANLRGAIFLARRCGLKEGRDFSFLPKGNNSISYAFSTLAGLEAFSDISERKMYPTIIDDAANDFSISKALNSIALLPGVELEPEPPKEGYFIPDIWGEGAPYTAYYPHCPANDGRRFKRRPTP